MTAPRLSTVMKRAAELAKDGLVVDILPDGTIRIRPAETADSGDEFATVRMK